MGFALVIRELLRHRALLAAGAVVAVLAAVLSVYRIDGTHLKARSLTYSSASTQALVDSSSSALGNTAQSIEPLATRAAVYASFMTNPAVLGMIGKQVGLSGEQLYAAGPALGATRTEQEPTAAKRNVQITGETRPYRLTFESHETLPTITINTQAPTTAMAIGLANASVAALGSYVEREELRDKVPASARVVVQQLGPPHGGVVDSGISKSLAAMVFLAVFAVWCALMLLALRFRETWRQSAVVEQDTLEAASEQDADDADADAEGERHGIHIHVPSGVTAAAAQPEESFPASVRSVP